MTYSTLMVQLQLGAAHAGLLAITRALAERFDAGVIGVVACRPIDMSYGDVYTSGGVVQADYEEMARETAAAEAEFRAALGSRALGWRNTITPGELCDFVAREARGADLVITGVTPTSFLDRTRILSISDLVMQAGRPVLIVPEHQASLDLERVLVAWKDTREARRAISDALPMLKQAGSVTLLELVSGDDLPPPRVQLGDVVEWLARHGIDAEPVVQPSSGDDAGDLDRYARTRHAGLIVAGAYGHSRLREWVLGGVTRDLLLRPGHCSLVSH
jgi:nucleotide-binding universal stress UspA family protein